jgi:3-dehydroquinate dehydratase/shikimate dehydrogenase
MVQDVPQALAEAQRAKDAGADLIEFRIDECFSGAMGGAEGSSAQGALEDSDEVRLVLRVVAQSPLPCIVTCRTREEGGHYEGDEMARVALLERLGIPRAGEHPPRYVDVEWSSLSRSANLRQKVRLAVDHPGQLRETPTALVLSTHDFGGRPADLLRRVVSMTDEDAARVVKVAYRARSLRDALELLDLPAQVGKPTIALGMGEFGVMSRVLAPKFGAFLTFASLRGESATAPGQPTVRELLDTYRFRSIGGATRVYGIVGWPVAHSLSPLVHNAGFGACGHDGVYVPMPIAAYDDAGATRSGLRAQLLELIEHPRLSFGGASVTMPHKEHLVAIAREQGWTLDDASREIGAGNTIVVERSGNRSERVDSIRVMNTDAPAIAACLDRALRDNGPDGLEGARVGVVGAGGVGRAAAWACARAGATVVLYGRDLGKVRGVAGELSDAIARGRGGAGSAASHPPEPGGEGPRIVPAGIELLERACCDAFVQCTPVGMAGGADAGRSAMPIGAMGACAERVVLLETVYRPVETWTLRAARERGWRTVDGLAMFVEQAALQFGAWVGREAPRGLFDRLVREASSEAPREREGGAHA